MGKNKKLSPKYQIWVDARKKFRLSHAHIQMAREMGMNPKKFGGLANHKQEPWKAPLPEFIENRYFDKFGKTCPDNVRTIEDMVKEQKKMKEDKKMNKELGENRSNKNEENQFVANNYDGNELKDPF